MFVVLLRPWYEMKMDSGAGSVQFDTKNPLAVDDNVTEEEAVRGEPNPVVVRSLLGHVVDIKERVVDVREAFFRDIDDLVVGVGARVALSQ